MPKRNEPGAETSWQAMERTRKRKEAAISTLMSKSIKKHNSQPNVLPPGTKLQVQAKRFWKHYPQKLLPDRYYPRSTIASRAKPDGTSVYVPPRGVLQRSPYHHSRLAQADVVMLPRSCYRYGDLLSSCRTKLTPSNSQNVILPGLWTVEFCQALLDFAEREHDWDVAYGSMKVQYSLRSNGQGPNGDKADVEGFMTEDIVEALAEWRREKEEEEERAAAALAEEEEEEARASRRSKRRRLLP
ncbi:hypothetical protein LTR12_013692 [Friedmanniomyces endolithicus]|nr:hypothetical protein LTR12_013692 [Friedmanniomyces endolithicus]